jgi:cytochrome c oxidase cbb3-type subunit 3
VAVLVAAAFLAGCDESRSAEPAPAGGLPLVPGAEVGPQPGPDRPLPEVNNPLGGEVGVLQEGRRLFTWYNCSGCHGDHGGGGMGPSLRDVTWMYGGHDDDIFNSIAEGRANGMPAWGTKLPSEQIWQITAYIRSMRTAAEPDPPPQNPVYPDSPEEKAPEAAEGAAE